MVVPGPLSPPPPDLPWLGFDIGMQRPCLEKGFIFAPSQQDWHFLRRKRVSAENEVSCESAALSGLSSECPLEGLSLVTWGSQVQFPVSHHWSHFSSCGRFVARGQGQGMGVGWGGVGWRESYSCLVAGSARSPAKQNMKWATSSSQGDILQVSSPAL